VTLTIVAQKPQSTTLGKITATIRNLSNKKQLAINFTELYGINNLKKLMLTRGTCYGEKNLQLKRMILRNLKANPKANLKSCNSFACQQPKITIN
jgi:hypothetical protein